jgi:hypothetical protein
MIFHRIKSNIVSHFSYFIGSGKDVFVVDLHRDIHEYLLLARQHGFNIKYIFETHRNEDYVVGSRELAHHTGAIIYHGPWPELKYGEKLLGGEEFKVGNLKIHALHTPGHTARALLKLSREEFIEYKAKEHHEFIPYFKMMEKYNVEGAPFYRVGPQIKALSPKEFKESVNKGATVIDTRPPPSYGAGHIKGAYSLTPL